MDEQMDFITADELEALKASGTGQREAGLAKMDTLVKEAVKTLDDTDQPGAWVDLTSDEVVGYLRKPSKMTMDRRVKLLVWRVLDRTDRKDDYVAVLDPKWDSDVDPLPARVGVLRR